MDENTLFWISLACTSVGLISLFIVLKHSGLPEYDPDKTMDEQLDEDVRLQGKIKKVSETENSYILTVTKENDISVIIRKEAPPPMVGDDVLVEGKVEEYNGRIYINPRKISLLQG